MDILIINSCCCSHVYATVYGRNPAPVELGSLSHCLQGFIHPRWLFGISAHQQYVARKGGKNQDFFRKLWRGWCFNPLFAERLYVDPWTFEQKVKVKVVCPSDLHITSLHQKTAFDGLVLGGMKQLKYPDFYCKWWTMKTDFSNMSSFIVYVKIYLYILYMYSTATILSHNQCL